MERVCVSETKDEVGGRREKKKEKKEERRRLRGK
jgi:hypothetical protein